MDEREDGVAVFFLAMGPDPAIPSLPELLGCARYGRPLKIGDPRPDGQGVADFNYAAVAVVPKCEPVDASMQRLAQWLGRHSECLGQLDAEKTVEFQSYLFPGIGSKFLTIPLEVVRLCGEVDCKIAHQSMRIPSKDELDRHRSQG